MKLKFRKTKSRKTKRPNGWTEDMFKDLVRGKISNNVNLGLFVQRYRQETSIYSMSPSTEIVLDALLTNNERSQLSWVHAEIRFEAERGALEIPERAIGQVKFDWREAGGVGEVKFRNEDTSTEGYKNPILSVVIVADEKLQNTILEDFVRNKTFGNEFLPIWIWIDCQSLEGLSAEEIMDSENRPIIKQCSYSQILDLRGAVPQDGWYL